MSDENESTLAKLEAHLKRMGESAHLDTSAEWREQDRILRVLDITRGVELREENHTLNHARADVVDNSVAKAQHHLADAQQAWADKALDYRDRIALEVMSILIKDKHNHSSQVCAARAYNVADEMVEARDK